MYVLIGEKLKWLIFGSWLSVGKCILVMIVLVVFRCLSVVLSVVVILVLMLFVM